MNCLVDTNVLLRIAQIDHPQFNTASNAVESLRQQGETLVIAPQNLVEAWAVATRPVERNGLGFTVPQAMSLISNSERYFHPLPDHPDVFARWKNLVETHAVLGLSTHDARIAAFMSVHQVPNILTFNEADFRRFPDLTIISPHAVVPNAP